MKTSLVGTKIMYVVHGGKTDCEKNIAMTKCGGLAIPNPQSNPPAAFKAPFSPGRERGDDGDNLLHGVQSK